MSFPMLTIEPHQKVHLAVCENCSVVRAINVEPTATFPDSGYWIECPVCRTYTMFWRVIPSHQEHGHFELKVDAQNNTQPMAVRSRRRAIQGSLRGSVTIE